MRLHGRWLFLIAMAAVFTGGFFLGRLSLLVPQREQTTSYNDVLASAQADQIRDVTINGTTLIGHYRTGGQFSSSVPSNDPKMFNTLLAHGVNITYKDEDPNFWFSTIISVAPFLILLTVPFAVLGLIVFVILRSCMQKPSPQQ